MTPYTKEKSEPLEKTLNNFYHTKNIKFNPDTDDIFEFVNSLGFEIWKLPLDNENLDGIILAYKGEKKIGLNESLPLHHAQWFSFGFHGKFYRVQQLISCQGFLQVE